MRTGEAMLQMDSALNDSDLQAYWPLVEAADKSELDAFIEHDVFAAVHASSISTGNVLDAVWVRRWKRQGDGSWIVKSRLCGRGFLDSQRHAIQRHSSTASRLSQRLAASLAAQHPHMTMES